MGGDLLGLVQVQVQHHEGMRDVGIEIQAQPFHIRDRAAHPAARERIRNERVPSSGAEESVRGTHISSALGSQVWANAMATEPNT